MKVQILSEVLLIEELDGVASARHPGRPYAFQIKNSRREPGPPQTVRNPFLNLPGLLRLVPRLISSWFGVMPVGGERLAALADLQVLRLSFSMSGPGKDVTSQVL